MKDTLKACPFCGEDDFDLIGLKLHLLNYRCDAFRDLDVTFIYPTPQPAAKERQDG